MRPLLAAALLCAPAALAGCQTWTTGMTNPCGESVERMPQCVPPSPLCPATPAAVAQETPAATVIPAVYTVTTAAPGADEVAEALKEYEDALATLRTAQRALEASHKKLQKIAKRAPQESGATPVPSYSLPAPISASPAPVLVAPPGLSPTAPAPTGAAPVRTLVPPQAPLPPGGFPAPAPMPTTSGAVAPGGVLKTTESRKVTATEPTAAGVRGVFRALGDWLGRKPRPADDAGRAAEL